MASKTYSVYFRATDTGLTPTFVKFTRRSDNVNLLGSAPAISEVLGPGGGFGEYKFTFDATVEVSFVVDGGASITSTADRYVRGVLGPEDSRLDAAISAVPAAVADEPLAGHVTADTVGKVLSDIGTNVLLLRKYEEGRWKVHASGGDLNRLVLYDSDGTTPLLKFDLKDASGSATYTNPFERVKVP